MIPSFLVAGMAGLLSFLTPCILPLVPVYLAVLAGGPSEVQRKATAVIRALLFILGFTLVFMLLGLSASAAGQLLRAYRPILERIGGVIVFILGLYQLGVVRLLPLEQERRLKMPEGGSPLAAFFIGIVFAFGWTPCVGPVLAGILALAGTAGKMAHGALLLLMYSAGLGLPFLAAALAYDSLVRGIKAMGRWTRYFQMAGGVLLMLLGLLLLSGRLEMLSGLVR